MTTTPAASPSAPSSVLRVTAVPLMLLAGALLAAQSEINGRLADELGSGARAGFGAAVVSFGSGLLVLAVSSAVLAGHRASVRRLVTAVRTRTLRPVELVGGLFGAFLVATQGLTVAAIGVALFSVAVTAGQTSSGLLVDHVGLGPSGRQRLSVPRLVAAAFAVVAVGLAVGERLVREFSWETAVLALLPLLAGAGTAVQQALNGRVSAHVGPWVTTLNNFTVGTIALLVAFGLSFVAGGELDGFPDTWWLYVGGVMGVTFIWLAALLVKVHGVLVLGLSIVAGQVVGAEAIEVAGGDAHVGPVGIAAGALTVAGVLIALGLRPRRTP